MEWKNITNPKDWFENKAQFEKVQKICEMFNAQEIKGVECGKGDR